MKMLTVFFMSLVQLDPRYMAQNIFVLRLEAFKDLSWLNFFVLNKSCRHCRVFCDTVESELFFVITW